MGAQTGYSDGSLFRAEEDVGDLIPLPVVPPVPPPLLWPAQIGRGMWLWADEAPVAAPRERRKRVLVIDDDLEISGIVREILEDEGYEVTAARDGGQALTMLGELAEPPDVILLDMRMPGVNGWDFATAYRSRPGRHAPLVTMTAAADANKWAQEIGADGV